MLIFSENPTRLNFITRKDVVNVRLAYNLPPSPTVYNRGRPRKRWPEQQGIINSQGQYVILEGQPDDVLLSDTEQPQVSNRVYWFYYKKFFPPNSLTISGSAS